MARCIGKKDNQGNGSWNEHDNVLACKLFKEATVLDPEYGPACEFWGWIYHKFIP
jgi:hypothetical protein